MLRHLPLLSPVPRHQRAHLVVPAAFSADECDRIVSLCEPEPAEPATLEGVEHVGTTRSSSVSWLPADEDTWWIYDRLGELAVDANEHWGFELVGFEEELQYTRYDGPGDHYAWHRDGLDGAVSTRKLSIVVQLTPPEHYEGGALEFPDLGDQHDPFFGVTDGPHRSAAAEEFSQLGTAVMFPAFEYHRVTPLNSGRRRSLVAWVAGPPFR
ncbi:MAG: 2OG-Fe(II) oxygenase [Candidatus Microthrix sp.]|nr:2OG-Fe(II) oxygenase [Candidatus Microthrix sp.]